MEELKTLNEIEDGVSRNELRKEAMKWIGTTATDYEELFGADFGDGAWFVAQQIDNWIKHFFNLETEAIPKE